MGAIVPHQIERFQRVGGHVSSIRLEIPDYYQAGSFQSGWGPQNLNGGMSIPSDWKFLESGGLVLPHQIGSTPKVGNVSPPSD